jgi:hypothetical protein
LVIRASAAGFKLTTDQLKQLAAPVIVFVQPLGYKHFAVLRGIDRGRVFLADPARGNLRMSTGRFVSEWDGIVFVLTRSPQHPSPPRAGAARITPAGTPISGHAVCVRHRAERSEDRCHLLEERRTHRGSRPVWLPNAPPYGSPCHRVQARK